MALDLYTPDPRRGGAGCCDHISSDGRAGVIELAEIFRRHGRSYRPKFGSLMLPGHLRAMRDIESYRGE